MAEVSLLGHANDEKKKRMSKDMGFTDLVFSWSVSDDLYKSQKLQCVTLQIQHPLQKSELLQCYKKQHLNGPMFGPYSFINIAGGREELVDGGSLRNWAEVAVIMKIVHNVYRAWRTSKKELTICVISPYAAQVSLIQDKVGKKYEKIDGFSLKVKIIDGFQGGEQDIVIVSTVRSSDSGSNGFMTSPERTNVALTRARECLWILGNGRTLSRSESLWEELIADAKNRQCFFDANEDNSLKKIIMDVNKQLNLFDDLQNGNSSLFQDARWKVHISYNFRKSFAKLKSSSMKKSVLSLLVRLSTGWRPKNKSVDMVCEISSQVLKKFKVDELYVVCTIDIVEEYNYEQVLKVWDLLHLDWIPKLEKCLDKMFTSYTDNFINCCKEKCFERNLEIPKIWTASSEIIRFKNQNTGELGDDVSFTGDDRGYAEKSNVKESLLLMKFYPLSSGMVNHLLSDHGGREVELQHEVTDEQMHIVLFGKTSFVLGRSGTGKTSILTKRLFQREELHRIISEELCAADSWKSKDGEHKSSVLRQLFVTVSPKLCYAVKQRISNMKSFACGGNFSAENSSFNSDDADTCSDFNDIPDSFVNIPDEKYPLIITFHKFLMMLDGTLGCSYFKRFPDAREFLHGPSRSSRSVGLQTFIQKKEVNYDHFCAFYWPHFNTQHRKKLEPYEVFTEIMSHIKVGNKAGGSHDGKLSRDQYILLAKDRVSTLTGEMRGIVYDIFQDYENMKNKRGEFDLCDLVSDIHHRLGKHRYEGDKMDFVYIDEVQDLSMRQICLLKYICPNVEEGFFFAGDTAQTISRGIAFRFQDIRSLFYNEFIGDGSSGRKEKGLVSDTFHLKQNFRTHAGVLNLAQSVINVLYHFFPHSVDNLPPETSDIYGEAPFWLESGNDENAVVTIFGNCGSGATMVGFGAEQVILVRDDFAKREMCDYVGKNALVLTIVECKGLEFQDVLLYNFFGSSPLKNKWRVIYGYMEEENLLDNPEFPSFSHAKHNGLCLELKQLYVAITRTRQRLWICENKQELSEPMLDYWKRKNLVQVCKLDDSLVQAMQVASSPEEWKTRGIKLFGEKNYDMAIMCFERAGDSTWETLARASRLQTSAHRMLGVNPGGAKSYLREAAEMFESVGKAQYAAICYYDSEDFEKAGGIYLEKCGKLERAAHCYTRAGLYSVAAQVYAKGNYFSECLSVCTKGKLVELGLDYIACWKQGKEKDELQQEFLDGSALTYLKCKDNHSMMKCVRAFCSMDSKRVFLKSHDCLDELLSLEEESGNFTNAAEIARLRGYVLKEADLLGKAAMYNEGSSLILWYVVYESLWGNGSKGWPLNQVIHTDELFTRAKYMAKWESDVFYDHVCNEINILSHQNSSLKELWKYLHASRQHRSLRGEIFAIRKILDVNLHVNSSVYEWEDELPVDMIKYLERKLLQNKVSIKTLVFFWNLWRDSVVQVFEYLDCLEKQETGHNDLVHGEFCLDYLGVRKRLSGKKVVYFVQYPYAHWVQKADKSLGRHQKVVSIDVEQLACAAKYYWQSEVTSVGMKVLQTLEELHALSRSASVFHRSTCLLHMFEISKSLLDCSYLSHRHHGNKKALEHFLGESLKYVDHVFPLDWRGSLAANMVSLRKTHFSHELLRHLISKTVRNCNGKLSYNETGLVMMQWLGSRKLHKFEWEFSWTSFVNHLIGESAYANRYQVEDLLEKALRDAYNANRRIPGSMAPNCFLYLVERLLILASCPHGPIFTAKSSFLEWFIYQEEYRLYRADVSTNAEKQLLPSEGVYDLVSAIIERVLSNPWGETTTWVRSSGIDLQYYGPLLVLKLFMILSCLCLQSSQYSGLLINLLEMRHITRLLPEEFFSVLRRINASSSENLNPRIIAEAFEKVGDPLVIATVGRAHKISAPYAIFVDLSFTRSSENVVQLLFARKRRPFTNTICGVKPDANALNEKEGEPEISWKLYREISDALESGGTLFREISDALESGGTGGGSFISMPINPSEIKVISGGGSFISMPINPSEVKREMERNITILAATITRFSKREHCADEDAKIIDEAGCMLDDMKRLSSEYDAGYDENGFDISSIRELLNRMETGPALVDELLDRLLRRNLEEPILRLFFSGIQREMEKYIIVLAVAITRFSERQYFADEDAKIIDEAKRKLDDMTRLSSAYYAGYDENGFDVSSRELLERMETGRPLVDDLLDRLSRQNLEEPINKDEAEGSNTAEACTDEEEDREDAKTSENIDFK